MREALPYLLGLLAVIPLLLVLLGLIEAFEEQL